MRIVFLHHANVCRAGIERMICLKANMLAEQLGCEVVLLTYEQNGEPYPYALSPKVKCVDLGVRLYAAYRLAYPMRYFRKQQLRRRLTLALREFLKDFRADIVVCTDKDAHELQALVAAHTTERLVIEAHTGMVDHLMQERQTTTWFRKLNSRWDLLKLKRSVGKFDALIALTPEDAHCWQPYVPATVIPNALPFYPDQVAVAQQEFRRVISVGRLNRQKGQDLLLRVWQTVEQQHPDWHLDIYGDGNDRHMLCDLIRELNIKNVRVNDSTPDIYSEYMRCDFLVCSSRWESFGLILIESMSCGVPVVSFDCDNGPRNIISDGRDGLLARAGDVAHLAERMNWMIEHPELRAQMAKEARHSASRFREEEVLDRYAEFYQSLLV